jgi:hypothetical protein
LSTFIIDIKICLFFSQDFDHFTYFLAYQKSSQPTTHAANLKILGTAQTPWVTLDDIHNTTEKKPVTRSLVYSVENMTLYEKIQNFKQLEKKCVNDQRF